jgi:hypothetical protein
MLGFSPFAAAPFADTGGIDAVVNLTGVVGVTQLGTAVVAADANDIENQVGVDVFEIVEQ